MYKRQAEDFAKGVYGNMIKKNKIKQPISDTVLDVIIHIILVLASICTIYPFLNVVAKAFSSYEANVTGQVFMFPVGFQTDTFMGVRCV